MDARPFRSILVGPSLYIDVLSRKTPALYQVEGDGSIVVPCDPKAEPNADGVYLVENGHEEKAINGGARLQLQSLVPLSESADLGFGLQGQSSIFVTDDGKIAYPANIGPSASLHLGDLGQNRDWFFELNGSASWGTTFRRSENGGNGPATETRLQISIGREADASTPAPAEADVATLPEQPVYTLARGSGFARTTDLFHGVFPQLYPAQPEVSWPERKKLSKNSRSIWRLS